MYMYLYLKFNFKVTVYHVPLLLSIAAVDLYSTDI